MSYSWVDWKGAPVEIESTSASSADATKHIPFAIGPLNASTVLRYSNLTSSGKNLTSALLRLEINGTASGKPFEHRNVFYVPGALKTSLHDPGLVLERQSGLKWNSVCSTLHISFAIWERSGPACITTEGDRRQ